MGKVVLLGLWLSIVASAQRPDDVTDSTAAIQSAIDAHSGRVYLRADTAGQGAIGRTTLHEDGVGVIEIQNGGSGYCKAPLITLIGGGGEGAAARAQVDADCHISAIRVTRPGSGYKAPPDVKIVPQLRCYRVSQLHLYTGTVLEGDGDATCLIPDGSNRPVLYSEGAYRFQIRNLRVQGDGKTDVGLQFTGAYGKAQTDGSPGSDALLCTLDNVTVKGFRLKNIELNESYGFLFLNVLSEDSGGWGLFFRDGYNNATQIIGGEYSHNAVGGVSIGSGAIQLRFSSIAEGNRQYGLYYHGHLTGLEIDDAYFEGNGHDGTGWDVFGDFLDYDQPAIGVTIRNSLFNSVNAEGAAHVENTVDLEFSHNIGVPPLIGDAFTHNALILGRGTINPSFEGNTRIDIRNAAGTPVSLAPGGFLENALLATHTPESRVWQYRNTGPGCAGRAVVCRQGQAWKVPLALGSGAANITTVTQMLSARLAGHMVGAGAWMRTDSGSATAWVEVWGGAGVYTGSELNQPLRMSIDPEWRWVGVNVATPASQGPLGVRFRLYANDSNDGVSARAVYIKEIQGWLDAAHPPSPRPGATPASGLPILKSAPVCQGHADGIAGYEAAADKIWVCAGGLAKAH